MRVFLIEIILLLTAWHCYQPNLHPIHIASLFDHTQYSVVFHHKFTSKAQILLWWTALLSSWTPPITKMKNKRTKCHQPPSLFIHHPKTISSCPTLVWVHVELCKRHSALYSRVALLHQNCYPDTQAPSCFLSHSILIPHSLHFTKSPSAVSCLSQSMLAHCLMPPSLSSELSLGVTKIVLELRKRLNSVFP